MTEKKVLKRNEGVIIRLPDSVCEQLGIVEGDAIEIKVEQDHAVLRKTGKYTTPVVKVHNRCSLVAG